MRNLSFKLILLAILFAQLGFSISCRAAAESPTALDSAALEALYTEILLADSPFKAEDLEISKFSCRPDSIVLPTGKVEYKPEIGTTSGRLGQRSFTLEIFVDGIKVGEVKMNGVLELYGEVVSAAKHLSRNTILSAADLTSSRKNITMLNADLLQDIDLAVGKQLKTTLRPGAIVFNSLLSSPRVIKRGDRVIITAKSGQINVSVNGLARSAGAVGDVIKVKNMMSRREIYARIINPDEVEVEF